MSRIVKQLVLIVYFLGTLLSGVSAGTISSSNPATSVNLTGIVGDGVTPNGAALNALITAQGALLPYVFPPGTFIIDQTINIPTGFQMSCAGNATMFKAAAGMTTPMFLNSNTTNGNPNISISNCLFDGNKANQTVGAEVDAIKCQSCGNLKLLHLEVQNTEGHGIHLLNGGTVTGQVIDDLQCDGVGTYPTNQFGSCLAITDGTGVKISHLRAYNTAKAGIRFSGNGFLISDVECQGNGNGCIVPVAGSVTDLTINGMTSLNEVGPYTTDGLHLGDVVGANLSNLNVVGDGMCGISLFNGSENINISNSTFRDNGQTSGDLSSLVTITMTGITGTFAVNDNISTGGMTAKILASLGSGVYTLWAVSPQLTPFPTSGTVTDTTSGATGTLSLASISPILIYLTGVTGTINKGDTIIQGSARGTAVVVQTTLPTATMLRLSGVTGQYTTGTVTDSTTGATGTIAVATGNQNSNIEQTVSESRGGGCVFDNGVGSTEISFDNVRFVDDQTTPTQPYGLRLDNNTDSVRISNSRFSGNVTSPLVVTSVGPNIRIFNTNTGLTSIYNDNTSHVVTGTTSETTLCTTTIAANELQYNAHLRITGDFQFTGGHADSVRFYTGAFNSQVILTSTTNPDQAGVTADLIWTSPSAVRGRLTTWESSSGGVSRDFAWLGTASDASNMVVKFTTTPGNTADTVTQNTCGIERVN